MSERLIWERDGRDWPNRQFSRFVNAAGLDWHVQVIGDGPVVLLIHGTGASTHSFRTLAPLLAQRFTVVVPDLPGHGFTASPSQPAGYSLPRLSGGIATLLHAIGQQPVLVAGHSAGAAVAVRMALDASVRPIAVISLNGALLPFPGMANDFFRPAARFLASSSITAKTFSLFAGSRTSVEKMLRSTGSSIDPEGARLYARLAGNSGHVHGALALMANWDLRPLVRDLPRLTPDLVLVTGSRDGMVPPSESYRIRSVVPKARLVSLSGLGHLAHEERPDKIVGIIGTTITPCPAGGTTSPQPPTFQSCSPRHT